VEVCLAVQEACRVDHGIWMIGARAVPGAWRVMKEKWFFGY
jgi:hypothetical protein